MDLRDPGLRDTPERDVRESLFGPEQAQLDTLQDIAIRRVERRLWGWVVLTVASVVIAIAALVIATRPREHAPPPLIPATTVTCPAVPACPPYPMTVCPSLVCPQMRHHRRSSDAGRR